MNLEVNNLFQLFKLEFEVRRRKKAIAELLNKSALPVATSLTVQTALYSQLTLRRKLEAWELSRAMFRYWHLFHRPLAKAMYITVAIHVLQAVMFGGAIRSLKEMSQWGGA